MISTLFNEFLYQPLFNVLISLYQLTGDLGVSIILLTILIKLLLFPLFKKQINSQKQIKEIQPALNEIKEKFKDDREAQSRETMKLYKEKGVNPAAGCLPILIQLPILIALYRVFMPGKALMVDGSQLLVAKDMLYAWPWLANVDKIGATFLGLVDLTTRSVLLALISSILQFFQSKMTMGGKPKKKKKEKKEKKTDKEPDFQEALGTQMTYLMPVMTFFFGISFPAALPLYWGASTLIAMAQQKWLTQGQKKKANK